MAEFDKYGGLGSDPPGKWQSITLSGDTTLDPPCRGIWVGTTGNVKVDDMENTAVTIPSVPVGMWSGRFRKIYSTANGTTASNIFALY